MVIRAKLVIIILVFAILPMFLLTQWWYRSAVESVNTALRQGLNVRAQEVCNQIARLCDGLRARAEGVAARRSLQGYARLLDQNQQATPDSQARAELNALLDGQRERVAAVRILNRAGEEVFKLDGPALPDDAPLTIPVNVRLRDEAGNEAGELQAEVRASRLLEEAVGPRHAALTPVSASAAQSAREVAVLGPQGTVLYAANPEWQGRPYRDAFPPPVAAAFASVLAAQASNHDVYRIGNQDWMIRRLNYRAERQPERTELAVIVLEKYAGRDSLETVGNIMIGITFLLAMVATLLVYYFISGITDSIRRVTRGAKAVASGKLDYQIKVKSNDETGVLADAFNRMAARLREMIAKEAEQKQFESFARLSAVLTHDLKNSILSLSFLVSNMERKFDREGFREDAMRTLADSVSNLKNLVAKLSDPRAQTIDARQRENLNALVERVLARTAEEAGERYRVEREFAPRASAVVDRSAVERVVENLIINALEAMPEGGRLAVSTRVDAAAPGGHAVISVADTGKGMTPEFIRDRLFHPFATTKRKGIGLGLYSCRDIIEQHGGRIEVTSEVGAGTEFRILLPLAAEESRSQELKAATA
jgi:signal transduction histidine kinase